MILRKIAQEAATKQVLVHLNFSPLFPSWPVMTCPSTYFAGDFSFPCSRSQNIKIGYGIMVRKKEIFHPSQAPFPFFFFFFYLPAKLLASFSFRRS